MSAVPEYDAEFAAHQPSASGGAAYPVAFSGMPGLFQPAAGTSPVQDLATIFISPWGLDELCTRRFFRIFAEHLSAAGIASLRFDLPGTANALDAPDATIDIDTWTDAALAGAKALKAFSGARHVATIGFGLGAAIALRAGMRIDGLAGTALLAPVVAGRRYLRELALWSTVIDEGVGVAKHMRDTAPGTVAGLTMPDGIVATLGRMNLQKEPNLHRGRIFLAARSDNAPDRELGALLSERGARVQEVTFHGYDKLVSNPLGQEIPTDLIDDLTDWLLNLPDCKPLSAERRPISPTAPAVLTCGPIRETGVRFGPAMGLVGTLCEPVADDCGVTVVLLTTGYDHQAGWARSSVDLARRLALSGVGSLRFDSAGIGDSPPVDHRKEQVLYDDAQIADIAEARRFLDENGRPGPALLFGRCSGAYVAFRAAAEDDRWAGCIVVNPYIFRWLTPPTEEMISSAPRPLDDYSQKALRLDTVRRLLAGDIDVRAAARNVGLRLVQRASGLLAPLLGPLLPVERLNRAVHADFRSLSQRPGTVSLVYSAGDAGLDNFQAHFGKAAGRLADYPNARLHILPDADHNVTPRSSRDQLFAIVEEAAVALSRR